MVSKLSRYNQKRDFEKTGEPRGAAVKKRVKQLRFVVQHHLASRDHYDLRLEWDGVLKSWAVPKGPSYDSHDKRLAVQVEDHPLDYRDFEGVIPEGEYGGGVVMIWDEGKWLPYGDAEEGLANGSLKFTLEGNRLKGKWALIRMKPKDGEADKNWLLIKERDEFEKAYDIQQFSTSVKTDRNMNEIEEGKYDASTNVGDDEKKGKSAKPKRAAKRSKSHSIDDFEISNPDKILYKESGISKGDIANYYLAVADQMLPYMEKRILSAVRCPSGIEKPCFYKKHPANKNRGIVTVEIPTNSGEPEEYFYIVDVEGLMFEVQMNTLEFHTWGSRIEKLEKPDVMVFDLDPDEGMELDRIRQGVRDLQSILDELSIQTFLKTSGGKGYHVVIPFQPAASWTNFSKFAQNIAKTMEAKWPDRYTSNVRKNQRNNRIFIDWIRNGRGATSIAPFSVRAREGAPVSMPIGWKELDTVTPNGISMQDAIARLKKKDPWDGFFDIRQKLK